MSHTFKTKEFKDLQKDWERRLKQAGFDDIERKDRVGRAAERLRTDVMENISHTLSVGQFEIKQEYYRLAGQFLHEHKFKTSFERTVWEMHSNGISVVDIVKALQKTGRTAYKDKVHGAIKRLAAEMKKHARSR